MDYFRYDPDQLEKFRQLFTEAKRGVIKIGEGEYNKSSAQGSKYSGNLQKDTVFEATDLTFRFFSEYNILPDAKRHVYEFNIYHQNQSKFIDELKKNYSKMTQQQKNIFDLRY